jgi:hypothetical protein
MPRAMYISEQLQGNQKSELGGIEMAIQKKSLISGKSSPKKATSTMPQVSENPGITKVAHTRVAHTRMAATKVALARLAVTRTRAQ